MIQNYVSSCETAGDERSQKALHAWCPCSQYIAQRMLILAIPEPVVQQVRKKKRTAASDNAAAGKQELPPHASGRAILKLANFRN